MKELDNVFKYNHNCSANWKTFITKINLLKQIS